jgi:hypothetical protein
MDRHIDTYNTTLDKTVNGTKLQSQLVMQYSIQMRKCSSTSLQQ